jgi:hypothetical protein
MSSQQSAISSQQSAVSSQQSAISSQQSAVSSQQSAISNQQSTISSQQSAVSSQQSAISSQQSAVCSQQSAINSQQSAISSQQSAVSNQQSAVSNQQSVVSSQQSAISSQQSAVSSQQSAVGSQEQTHQLDVSIKLPDSGWQRQGVDQHAPTNTCTANATTITNNTTREFSFNQQPLPNTTTAPLLRSHPFPKKLQRIRSSRQIAAQQETLPPHPVSCRHFTWSRRRRANLLRIQISSNGDCPAR